MALPSFQEKLISQLPAVKLLQNLGYEYLSSAEAVNGRAGRLGSVLLDKILAEQLRRQNAILFWDRPTSPRTQLLNAYAPRAGLRILPSETFPD